jgi:MFS transporter, SP family, general alpha glucoside:H+ symporter
MESFDMFLNGNFVAQGAFQRRYGVLIKGSDPPAYAIPTRWQSALFQSGQCGAFVGVFLAGPVTNRLGYRWTTIFALALMNATIFISFFVNSPSLPLCSSPNNILLGRLPRGPYGRTSA